MSDLKPCAQCGGTPRNIRDLFAMCVTDGCAFEGRGVSHRKWNNRPTERAARVAGIREAAMLLEGDLYSVEREKMNQLADSIERGEG